MDPVTLALIMGGTSALGLFKSMQQNQQAKDEALLQADVAQYSPWTGMAAKLGAPKTENPLFGAADGALSGLNIANTMDDWKSDKALKEKLLNDPNSSSSIAANVGGGSQKMALPSDNSLGLDYSWESAQKPEMGGMSQPPPPLRRKGLYSSMSEPNAKSSFNRMLPYGFRED